MSLYYCNPNVFLTFILSIKVIMVLYESTQSLFTSSGFLTISAIPNFVKMIFLSSNRVQKSVSKAIHLRRNNKRKRLHGVFGEPKPTILITFHF